MKKTAYWISTGIILFFMIWSFVTYHVIYENQSGFFEKFGYPTYLVYPLAWLKLVAAIVIVTHKFNDLRDMVYAAYYINMTLALVGHLSTESFFWHALVGMIVVPISYLLGNQVRGRPNRNFFGRWTEPKAENE